MKTQFKKLLLAAPLALVLNFANANPLNCTNMFGELEMTVVPGAPSLQVTECGDTFIAVDKANHIAIISNASQLFWETEAGDSKSNEKLLNWLGLTATQLNLSTVAVDFSNANTDRLKSLRQLNASFLPPKERETILFALVNSGEKND